MGGSMHPASVPTPDFSDTGLPVEIAFLAPGIPRAILSQVAARAEALAVSPADMLIADCICSEAQYYGALAAEVGLAYSTVFTLRPGVPVEYLDRCSVALSGEEDDVSYVIAPRGK